MSKLKEFKLSPTVVLVLGVLLTAAEGVQLNVSMSTRAHVVLTMAITVIVGAGLKAVSPATVLAKLPPHLVTFLSSLLGAVIVTVQAINIGQILQTIVAVVIVGFSAIGIGPTAPPEV